MKTPSLPRKKRKSKKKGFPLPPPQIRLRRKRVVFMLNEAEYEALENYCRKYKIKNRSGLIRSTLMTTILKRFNEDYPTLFND